MKNNTYFHSLSRVLRKHKNIVNRDEILNIVERDFADRKPLEVGLFDRCYKKEWVVYCKPLFKTPACVVEYWGRYTHVQPVHG